MDTPESIEGTPAQSRQRVSGESLERLTTTFNELSDAFIKFSVAYAHVKQQLIDPER